MCPGAGGREPPGRNRDKSNIGDELQGIFQCVCVQDGDPISWCHARGKHKASDFLIITVADLMV